MVVRDARDCRVLIEETLGSTLPVHASSLVTDLDGEVIIRLTDKSGDGWKIIFVVPMVLHSSSHGVLQNFFQYEKQVSTLY